MKRILILLSLLGPCNSTDGEDVVPASSALDSSDDLRKIKDAGPDVSAPVCQVPEAASPLPPSEPERFIEFCLPGTDAYYASHKFEGISDLEIEARVSVLCVKTPETISYLPDFPFETLQYMAVAASTVTVACGYKGEIQPRQNCSQVVFYLKP